MLVPTGAEGKYEYDPSIPAGSGGGGDITVESLSVTENDTYTAPAGKAYSPVVVNVSGGGSSNYTITLISAPHPQYPDAPASESYYINCFDENYTYLGGAVKTNEGYVGEYPTGEVWADTPQDIEVIIFPSKGIRVASNDSGQPLSVTGDAEIVHHEDKGYWDVYVTGNCTITYQGSR